MLLADSSSDPGAAVAAAFLVAWLVLLYFVPTIVALARHRKIPNVGSVVVINVFLGWSIVGWVVALAMAVRSRPQQPQYAPPGGWQQMPPQ